MIDVLEVAAPSAAIETQEPEQSLEIPRARTPEYAKWREDGTIPPKQPNADAAPADKPKEATSEAVTVPEPVKQESRRKPDAEARIRELTEENRRHKQELEELRKPKETQAESSPARPPEPQNYSDWRKAFKPNEWVQKYVTDHPTDSYEEANAAMADHLADMRDQFKANELRTAQNLERVTKEVEEAKGRYPDFWEKAAPIIGALNSPGIPREVSSVINASPVLADLLYTIGGTDATSQDFLDACRTDPPKAIRVALLIEQEIRKELSKDSTQRNDRGQFVATEPEKPPAKRGPESAPEPPIEIGNRGSIADAGEQDPDKADFRAFKRSKDAEQLKRLKGA